MSTQSPSYDTPCEHGDGKRRSCGAPSTYRYEAMGGGYMHLCEAHGYRHADISEHISGRVARIAYAAFAMRAALTPTSEQP